jgi:hypothetical protein
VRRSRIVALKLFAFVFTWQVAAMGFSDIADVDAGTLAFFSHLVQWLKNANVPFPTNNVGVKVTVTSFAGNGREPISVIEEGMLVVRNASRTVVYTDEMRLLSVSPQQGSTMISVEELKLTDLIQRRLESPQSFDQSNTKGFCWERGMEFGKFRSSQSLDLKCRKLLLAYWCHELGEIELRNRLLIAVFPADRRADAADIVQYFSDRYASCLLDRAIVSVDDPRHSHSQIADQIDWVNKTFWKQGSMRPEVIDLVERLRVVGSVAEINPQPDELLDDATLVRQLCHQRCHDCRIDFSGDFDYVLIESGHMSPAGLLLQSGPKAAPALLKAIGDQTPTRRVLDGSPHQRGPKLSTVSSMAVDLLTRLLGNPSLPYMVDPSSDEEIELTRAAFQDLIDRTNSE